MGIRRPIKRDLFQGLAGSVRSCRLIFRELEAKARECFASSICVIRSRGAGDEAHPRPTVEAFPQVGLIPPCSSVLAQRDLSIDLFGLTLPSPLFMAPIRSDRVCRAGWGHGDLATCARPPPSTESHGDVDLTEMTRSKTSAAEFP